MTWHREQIRKPGVTTQVLLADALRERDQARDHLAECERDAANLERERDEARTALAQAQRVAKNEAQVYLTVSAERDDARAMAQRLAFELREHLPAGALSCVDNLCTAFDALDWSRDE